MKSILSSTKPRSKCAICRYWDGERPEVPLYGYFLIDKENQGNCAYNNCTCSALEECENFELDENYSPANILTHSAKILKIHIPANIDKLDIKHFENFISAEEITVDEENKHYCSVDGVLFSKDKKTLVYYPTQKKDEDYTIPKGTENIVLFPSDCPYLKHLHLPVSLKNMGNDSFNFALLKLDSFDFGENEFLDDFLGAHGHALQTKKITVDKSNSKYCALDGVLYSKDMKNLLAYPNGKEDTSFAIPEGVTTLPKFILAPNLKEIHICASVTEIHEYTFLYCGNLEKITVDANNPEFEDDDFHRGFVLE